MSETKQKGGFTRYSEQIKKEAVYRYLSQEITIEKLHQHYGAGVDSVRGWIARYKDEILLEYFQNDLSLTRMKKGKKKSLEKERERLEAEVRQLRLQAEGYKYMLDLASEQYGEDLLKKAVARQSAISKKDTPG